jgi:uncharacterized membrane protein YfcA
MMEAAVIGAATLLGAFSQRVVGFGTPLFIVPALLIYFSPPVTLIIFLIMACVSNLLVIFAHKEKREIVWPIVLRLVVPALPSLIVGALIVTHINKAALQIIIGSLVVVAVLIQEFAFPKPTSPLKVSKGISLSGLIAGLFNSLAGLAGPSLILWFRTHKCTPNQLRHNLATIFTFMNIVSFVSIWVSKPEALTSKPLLIAVALLPIIFIGNFTGSSVARRINRHQFEMIMLWVVIATGAMTVALGAINL